MITEGLKKLLIKYDIVDFKLSYIKDCWKIKFDSDNFSATEDQKVFIKEDEYDYYDLLIALMPGSCLTDEYGVYVGNDRQECVSYKKEGEEIVCYSGSSNTEYLFIHEKHFKNEYEFYDFIFNKYSNVSLRTEELKLVGLKTPFEIFICDLSLSGYHLMGFKRGGSDDDGYSICGMVLENKVGKRLKVEYPIKDAFNNWKSDFLSVNDVDIFYFKSDYLELLGIDIVDYIDKMSWD